MSIKITTENYDIYKKVYVVIMARQWQDLKDILPESSNPINVIDEIELKSKSLAKTALQAGLNDILSNLKEYPKQTLEEIDLVLKEDNLPELNSLLDVIQKTINKILKAKKINDVDQYYIIKEVLDTTTSDITEGQRQILSKYLGDFEKSTEKITNG
jgi:ClpP class serine protease